MQIGPGDRLLSMMNPVLAAEEAATLDWLSDGNYVLGVGLGCRPEEFQANRRGPARSGRTGCCRNTAPTLPGASARPRRRPRRHLRRLCQGPVSDRRPPAGEGRDPALRRARPDRPGPAARAMAGPRPSGDPRERGADGQEGNPRGAAVMSTLLQEFHNQTRTEGFAPGSLRPSGRKFETRAGPALCNTLNFLTSHNQAKMAVVQLRRRKWPEKGRKRPEVGLSRGTWEFGQFARSGRILRASDRYSGLEKECPDWASWRRERSCRQTLSV